MTRATPVSKYRGRSRAPVNIGGAPRDGSHLAEIYHRLRRGEDVKVHSERVRDLTDYYGMEVVRCGWGIYRLAGEWDGPVFMSLEQCMAAEQSRDLEAAA